MPAINDKRLLSAQCNDLQPIITLHENSWFSVKNRGGYYTTEFTESQIIVLPTLEDSSIIMVKQLRPVINDITIELPAGGINVNEDPVIAAKREFFEETGINIRDIKRFKPLAPIANTPNRNPCLIHIFHVDINSEEFEKKEQHCSEIISVECFSYKKIIELMDSGYIYIGAPMAVIGKFLITKKDIQK
jgi:8-oxo-dGTP pyrophosphatase MutT (NUDIX family)